MKEKERERERERNEKMREYNWDFFKVYDYKRKF